MGKVLVVGGGIAGIQSSLDLAEMGHSVYLVEKEKKLGGNLNNLYKIFPKSEKADEFLSKFMEKVKANENISVLTDSTVSNCEEKAQAFKVMVDSAGKHDSFNVDAIVLATGFFPYDPTEKTEYGYNRYKDVITSIGLEKMLKEGKLARPSNSEKLKSISFIQCVGFRDVRAYKYCSYFCCTLSVKDAMLIKKENPDIDVAVMYMDIRTPFTYENFYTEARSIGVKFIRARPAEIFEKNSKLAINFEDTLTSETRTVESDLVVLSVGATPPPENKILSEMMKVELDDMGFFKVHDRLSRTNANRIFVAGAACGPKDIDYSLSQAGAAASQINKLLS